MTLENKLAYKIIVFILGAIIISIFGLGFSLYIGDFLCYELPPMEHSTHDDIEKYTMILMFILYVFLFIFYCKVCFVDIKKMFEKVNDNKSLAIFKIILIIYAILIIFIIFYNLFYN